MICHVLVIISLLLVVATVLSLPQALVVGHNIPVTYGAFYYLVLYMNSRGNNTSIDCYGLWVVGEEFKTIQEDLAVDGLY